MSAKEKSLDAPAVAKSSLPPPPPYSSFPISFAKEDADTDYSIKSFDTLTETTGFLSIITEKTAIPD